MDDKATETTKPEATNGATKPGHVNGLSDSEQCLAMASRKCAEIATSKEENRSVQYAARQARAALQTLVATRLGV